MDTIWSRPQEWVCACVDVLDIGWTDFQMCFASCGRSHKCYFGVTRSCHSYSQTTPLVSWWGKCVCICVCLRVFPGSSSGRGRAVIACSSPGAGYGHLGRVSCIRAKLHCGFMFVFSPAVHTSPSPAIYADHPFNPSVLKSPPFLVCVPIFATCFAKCLCVSLSRSQSMSHTHSLSTSVFWQGCISSLAVLLGGWRWGVPRDVRVH